MTDNAPLLAVATPQIMADEGCELHAYPDPLSGGEPWTIGYGATGPDIGPSTVWTLEQAAASLGYRLEALCVALDGKIPWWRTLNLPRQAVLLNLSYNVGVGGMLKFVHMLAAAQAGNFSEAADQMLASSWARQVRNRANRLAGQMESGTIAG